MGEGLDESRPAPPEAADAQPPEPAGAVADGGMVKPIVEAVLFAANRPMTARQIQQVFPELERPPLAAIESAVAAVAADYQGRPVQLRQVAGGYRFQVGQPWSRWVGRLFADKPPKYSKALLETLAIIAYRQPVTRGDIEDIRGVGVSTGLMQTLLEREWIRVVAHKESPGRPALYGTTPQFLDYFNLSALQQLPPLPDAAQAEGRTAHGSDDGQ